MSIRTYNKKKDPISIESVIQNYHELCRLCLQKSNDFINIFEADGFSSLPLRIMTCLGIDVKDDKWLPKTLCESCHKELTSCYKFRKKCLSINIQLQKHLKALRMCFRKAYIDQKNLHPDDTCTVTKTDSEKFLDVASNCLKKELLPTSNQPGVSMMNVNQGDDTVKSGFPVNVNLSHMETALNSDTLDKTSQKESPLKQNVTLDISKHIKFSLSSNSLEKSLGLIPQNSHEVPADASCETILSDYQPVVSSMNLRPIPKVIGLTENNSNSDIERIHLVGPNLINSDVTYSVERNLANLTHSDISQVAEKRKSSLCVNTDTPANNNVLKLNQVPTGVDYNQTGRDIRSSGLSSLIRTALHVSGRLGKSLAEPEYVEVMTKDGNMVTMEICEEAESNSSIQHGLVVSLPVDGGQSICSSDLCKRGWRWAARSQTAASSPAPAVGGAGSGAGAAPELRCPHEGCARLFAQREVLRRHMLLHEEGRPWVCTRCGKGYTQEAALRAHERSHAPPTARPITLYDCPLCPKKFCYQSGLSRHVMSHKGSRCICQQCGQLFCSPAVLRRHLADSRACAKLPLRSLIALETHTTVR